MKKKTIFVVEDDPDIAKSVSHHLRKKDYQILHLRDGKEALDHALNLRPDLIILDLMLPSLSGEEICKTLREHDDESIQAIPIIMLTAKSMISDRIVGKVIGANRYLTKPFSMEELLGNIETLLENAAAPAKRPGG